MAKTDQIGVRFDKEVLAELRKQHPNISPQKALNIYEKTWLKVADIKFTPSDEQSFDAPEVKVILLDEPSQFSTPTQKDLEKLADKSSVKPKSLSQPKKQELLDDDKIAIAEVIAEYENELKHLGKSGIAIQRRKYVEKQISNLKKQLQ